MNAEIFYIKFICQLKRNMKFSKFPKRKTKIGLHLNCEPHTCWRHNRCGSCQISVNIVVVNFAAMTLNVICVLSSRSKLSCYRFNAKLCYTQQLLISNNSRMWNSLVNGFDCNFELIERSRRKKTQIYWLTLRFMSVQQFLDSLIGISNPRRDERGCSTANQ